MPECGDMEKHSLAVSEVQINRELGASRFKISAFGSVNPSPQRANLVLQDCWKKKQSSWIRGGAVPPGPFHWMLVQLFGGKHEEKKASFRVGIVNS